MKDKYIDDNVNMAKSYREITVNSKPFQKVLRDAQEAANKGLSHFTFQINEFEYKTFKEMQIEYIQELETPLMATLTEMGFNIECEEKKKIFSSKYKYYFTISW